MLLVVPEFHLPLRHIHMGSISWLAICHCYTAVIDQSGGYGLEIPFLYHFHSHEKGVNWLKNRLELIGKAIVKETKHYLNDFKKINLNIFK